MKAKPEEKTEVTATTKVRLTIRGQTFEMTMEELKTLHEKIGNVVGEKPQVIFVPNDQARQRPWCPPPQFWQPEKRPEPWHRFTCTGDPMPPPMVTTSGMAALSF